MCFNFQKVGPYAFLQITCKLVLTKIVSGSIAAIYDVKVVKRRLTCCLGSRRGCNLAFRLSKLQAPCLLAPLVDTKVSCAIVQEQIGRAVCLIEAGRRSAVGLELFIAERDTV